MLRSLVGSEMCIRDSHNDDPNGSIDSIAGVTNEKRNILGIMPHPERTSQSELKLFGLTNSALRIFDSLIAYIKK